MSIKFVSNHYDNDIGFDLVFNSFDMGNFYLLFDSLEHRIFKW